MPSFGLGYIAKPALRAAYGPPIFNTALSLAERFNPAVGCTESWSPGAHCNARSAHSTTSCPFTVIIDNMMNLEILVRHAAIHASRAATQVVCNATSHHPLLLCCMMTIS